MRQIVDDGDDDTFKIPLTLRGSSPISQEVSKLAQCTVQLLHVWKETIVVENSTLDFRLEGAIFCTVVKGGPLVKYRTSMVQ